MRRRKRGADQVADLFEAVGMTAEADRWRLQHSDAGLYLRRIAGICRHDREGAAEIPAERAREFLSRAFEIHAEIEGTGTWEETHEWRISTAGTDRLERVEGGYRATASYHGDFAAEFRQFVHAYEALRVFSKIQMDLFYAIGWSSWARQGGMLPKDPEPPESRKRDQEYPYLRRIAKESRESSAALVPAAEEALAAKGSWSMGGKHIRIARITEWDDRLETVYEFELVRRSLSMSSVAPTVERAVEFLGVYEELQRDLEIILEWRCR